VSAHYRFGPISVHATVELPELPFASVRDFPVIEIEACDAIGGDAPQHYHAWVGESGEVWLRMGRDARGYSLEFPGLAEFRVSHDARAVVGCCRAASPTTFRHLLLDQVLPLMLSHQGWCVLHAAAVETPEGAAAFLGSAGRGKSTMTASLAAAGLAAITDDTLMLTAPVNGPVTAHPAYPSLRMWPESAEAVFGRAFTSDGRVSDLNDKVRIGPSGGLHFCGSAMPLRTLYVLTPDTEIDCPRIEAISPRDRVMEVVRHSFVLDWKRTDGLRSGFAALGRVADRVAVRRLRFRHDYGELATLRKMVLEDLRHAA
jgi:hypothetical protein